MAIDAVLIGARGTSATNTVTTTGGSSTGGSGSIGYLVVSFDPGVTISTVSDSKSNTYSLIGSVLTGGAKLARYKCENWTGGASHTATVTFSGSAFPTLHLCEITGAATSSPEDTAAAATSVSSMASPWTITSGTLAQAASVCMAGIGLNSAGSDGAYATSNFSLLSQEPSVSSFWTSAVAKLVVAATSAVTPSWTCAGRTSPQVAERFIDVFKEASAGAPTIDTQPISQSVFSGQTATFTIAATTSGGTLHYQWKFDGANVGSDSNSYARSLCVAADSGKTVSCDVTDDNGTTSSATVNLYVDVNKMFYLLA